jgi:capsular polysaccharide biosynthesis protein
MYFRDFGMSLVRRWPLVLIGLILTAALATATFFLVPVSWTAKASVLILPPTTIVGETGNPYLFLSGLGQASDVLAKRLDAEDAHTAAQERYRGGDFTVATDPGSPAPVILIEADAPRADQALELAGEVHERVPAELVAMQRDLGVPTDALITQSDITVDTVAVLNPKTRIQATIIVAAAGLALTILLIGLVDGLARRRRDHADAESARLGADPDPEPVEPDTETAWEPAHGRAREPVRHLTATGDDATTA